MDTVRGKLRVRKWPAKRTGRLHPHTAYMNRWFRDACRKLKYADPRAVDFAIKATKGTGLYPRDLLMASMGEGLIDLRLPDGTPITYKRQGLHPVAFQGLITWKNAAQNVAANTQTFLTWPLPQVDTAGMFNLGQPTRITIPPGVNIVAFTGAIFTTNAAALATQIGLRKNGATDWQNIRAGTVERGSAILASGPVPVANGDYFELYCQYTAARTLFSDQQVYFKAEILDADYPA